MSDTIQSKSNRIKSKIHRFSPDAASHRCARARPSHEPSGEMLSPAVEDYLKTIYKLQGTETASTTDIARTMNVSSASVTSMVKRLAEMKLVQYQSYRGVSLTPAGEKIALEIIRHHRLLELYLKEVMGYGWEELHEEAEHLEHHISEAFESKIEELLGYPTHDPHGDPIPTREGEISATSDRPLSDVPSNSTVIVHRVSDADPELLHYLEDLGLMPRAVVEVTRREPFNGPLSLRVDGSDHVIGYEVARHIFVGRPVHDQRDI